jgi:hypothetical protein
MIRKAAIIVLTLAAVGVAGLMLLSGRDGLAWERGAWGLLPRTSVVMWPGALVVSYTHETPPKYRDPVLLRFGQFYLRDTVDLQWIYHTIEIGIPPWSFLVLFGVYPTIAFIHPRLRRWRRRRKGLCVKCGYDLTGNESGVCSECGTEVSQ